MITIPEKLSGGDYKCKNCGKILSTSRSAKKHEALCGNSKLDEHIDNIENLSFDEPEQEKKSSKQVKVGEEPVKACITCTNQLTVKDQFRDNSNLFECSKCGNIQRVESFEP